MPESTDALLDAAERLCQTLDRIGDALVALDANALLETEESLARVLALLGSGRTTTDHAALAERVARARDALLRCRRLGHSFNDMAAVRLRVMSATGVYGRTGAPPQPAPAVPAMRVTT